MKHSEEMTAGELEQLLSDLLADLEDIEEERMFVLGQTGVHVSGSTVAKYESEREALKARIRSTEDALRARRR
jgi:hypothetical protein